MMRFLASIAIAVLAVAVSTSQAQERPLREYFQAEVERIESQPLQGIDSAEHWKEQRPELQRQMREMLGLDPLPERTDLKVEITGTVEHGDFVVEKILYQSSPGLYVTGNLYRPKKVEGKLPAILYVCGHARVEEDGVIYGSKANYQHHPAWYASNGYVCLIVDTLQLGEVPGLHHGTHREGRYWWWSRGYTPAGIEVWNGIRAIDYLASRPEVDPNKIGVTGRSGGGGVSWYLGAVDDRLAAVIPVAGVTDLRNQILEGSEGRLETGVIEGHCDCMFMLNTYRWDFEMVGALVAPKPLLFENTDNDRIFPEDGVRRVYANLEKVYEWYDASDRLGLVIGEGGHADTEELRHPSFAFMDRWLKGKATNPEDIVESKDRIPVADLKVLEIGQELADQRNDNIDEEFVPTAEEVEVPESAEAWETLRSTWMGQIGEKVFRAWPEEVDSILVSHPYPEGIEKGGLTIHALDFRPESGPEKPKLRLWLFRNAEKPGKTERTEFHILSVEDWKTVGGLIDAFESKDGDPTSHPEFEKIRKKAQSGVLTVLFAPTGVGRTAWPNEVNTHTLRRFALLGQTLDSTRVLDVRRALRCLDQRSLAISGAGDAASLALWAGIFEPKIDQVILIDPPKTVREGQVFLNLERLLDMPQAVALLYPRALTIEKTDASAWEWPKRLAEKLEPGSVWPEIR